MAILKVSSQALKIKIRNIACYIYSIYIFIFAFKCYNYNKNRMKYKIQISFSINLIVFFFRISSARYQIITFTDGCNMLNTPLVKHFNDLLERHTSEREKDEVSYFNDFFLKIGILSPKVYTKKVSNIEE